MIIYNCTYIRIVPDPFCYYRRVIFARLNMVPLIVFVGLALF